MKDHLKGKTVLITGGTGSIGREIVKQMLTHDVSEVVVFSRDEIKHFLIKKRICDERLHTVVGDARDYRSVKQVFHAYDFDLVYHAAAMKHVNVCEESPIEAAKTNVWGTQNIVDAAVESKVQTLITISTDKSVYPMNVMGATKFIAEKITRNAGYSCVRFGNVANSRGSVIPVFIDNLLNRNTLVVSCKDVTRFLMRIEDAVRLTANATAYAKGGEVFILKMKAFKLGDLVDVITQEVGPELGIPSSDIDVRLIGLVPGEKLHETLIDESELDRIYEVDNMYVVLPRNREDEHMKKVELCQYTSNDVDMISKSEIKAIVREYLTVRRREGDLE
jgi:UDP-N-acetylglucosamine 4,6-dehydratase